MLAIDDGILLSNGIASDLSRFRSRRNLLISRAFSQVDSRRWALSMKAYSPTEILVVRDVRIDQRLIHQSFRIDFSLLVTLQPDFLSQFTKVLSLGDRFDLDESSLVVFDSERFGNFHRIVGIGDALDESLGVPDDLT